MVFEVLIIETVIGWYVDKMCGLADCPSLWPTGIGSCSCCQPLVFQAWTWLFTCQVATAGILLTVTVAQSASDMVPWTWSVSYLGVHGWYVLRMCFCLIQVGEFSSLEQTVAELRKRLEMAELYAQQVGLISMIKRHPLQWRQQTHNQLSTCLSNLCSCNICHHVSGLY